MQKLVAIFILMCWFLSGFSQVNITRVEYFIDTDPGFGNATTISIIPAPNISNNNLVVPLGSISPGLHALFMRSKDANGKWSITSRTFFYILPEQPVVLPT